MPRHASPALLSPTGLVWRLQRGALLGWATGLLGFGLVFGALSDQIEGLEGAATEWYATFGGDADLLGAYWASMMQIAGMAVAIYVVTLMLRLHHDEAAGHAGARARHRGLTTPLARRLRRQRPGRGQCADPGLRRSDGHHRRPGARRHCITAA